VTRLRDDAAGNVTQKAFAVLLAVVVAVHLTPAHLGNVLLLGPGGVGADGVDAKIDVIAPGVQVAEPGLGSAGRRPGRLQAMLDSGLGICAGNGKNSHAVSAVKHAVEKANGCLVSHESPWKRFWQYASQHSLRGAASLLPGEYQSKAAIPRGDTL